MTTRCACPDDENAHVDGGYRDPLVFGPCRTCPPESKHAANLSAELARLEREDPAVQAASSRLDAVHGYLEARLPSPVIEAIYDLARDVHAATKATKADFVLSPPDECDGMDSPVDQLDLERRTNPYDLDDAERGGY